VERVYGVSTAPGGRRGGRVSRSAGRRAAWGCWLLADASRLAGNVGAVRRFALIQGWRRASADDPVPEWQKGGMGLAVSALAAW
jgi:hypothetical protein